MTNAYDHIITEIAKTGLDRTKIRVLEDISEIHEGFTTLEKYPIDKLMTLCDYLTDLSVDHPLREGDLLFNNKENSSLSSRIHTQLKVLERILNLPDNVPQIVNDRELIIINAYGYRSDHCKGRMYGYRNTMTLISRQCRYYLFNSMYMDLDLKNAHPTMLYAYAVENNIETKILERYVHDREGFLKEVMEKDKLTRAEAKTAVLRCLNLVTDKSLPDTLKPLHRDILPIREHLYNSNIKSQVTPLGEYTMTRESFKGKDVARQKISLQAQYCASEESESLKVLYEVCLHKGRLDREASLHKASDSICFIPFFDGAYVHFEGLTLESEIQQILHDTNFLIYPYQFELKKIEPEWDYISEKDLLRYELIREFIGNLSESQFQILLRILNIPNFSIDINVLNSMIKNMGDSDYKSFQNGENVLVNTYIQSSVKLYKYQFRKKLLEYTTMLPLTDLLKEINEDNRRVR